LDFIELKRASTFKEILRYSKNLLYNQFFFYKILLSLTGLEKNHDLKKKKKIGFFKFKTDIFNLNKIFLFKLDLLFELIIFSNKKIIKFYYKIINVLFFFTKLTKL